MSDNPITIAALLENARAHVEHLAAKLKYERANSEVVVAVEMLRSDIVAMEKLCAQL